LAVAPDVRSSPVTPTVTTLVVVPPRTLNPVNEENATVSITTVLFVTVTPVGVPTNVLFALPTVLTVITAVAVLVFKSEMFSPFPKVINTVVPAVETVAARTKPPPAIQISKQAKKLKNVG